MQPEPEQPESPVAQSAVESAAVREITQLQAKLRGDVDTLRTGLQDEVVAIQSELQGQVVAAQAGLRGDMANLRTELRGEVAELQTKLTSGEPDSGSDVVIDLRTQPETHSADVNNDQVATITGS